MNRTYEVRPKAKVNVSDDGDVTVEVDLVNLPWEIENDYLAEHEESDVQEDIQAVRDALMASPSNHTTTITLQK